MSLSVEKAMSLAKEHEKKREFEQARQIYTAILGQFPNNARARKALNALGGGQQGGGQGIDLPQNEAQKLIAFMQQGRPDMAVKASQAIAARYPNSAFLWDITGMAKATMGRFVDAEACFRKVIAIKPGFAQAHNNLGNTLKEQGRLDEAAECYAKAAKIAPALAEAHNGLGAVYLDQEKPEEAEACFRRALKARPDYAEALNNLGNALREQDKLDEAVASYEQALKRQPGYAAAHNNLGAIHQQAGRLDAAMESFSQAIKCSPDMAEAHNNLGAVLHAQRRFSDAVESYRRALQLKPDYAEAHNNLGSTLADLRRFKQAGESFRRAMEIDPSNVGAQYNLSGVLYEQKQYDDVIAACDRLLAIEPGHVAARLQRLNSKCIICDWSSHDDFEDLARDMEADETAFQTFGLLSIEDNPRRQLLRAGYWAREHYPDKSGDMAPPEGSGGDRIRVGYFSSDFHDHATMYLMSGLFRNHDKSRFEIFVYSLGKTKTGRMREQLIQDVDKFVDIDAMSERDIVRMAREHELDIAIDLKGNTHNTVSDLFPYRLAPVQMSYLGYPGTLAMETMDYIIADPIVIPDAQREFYTENVVYLPDTYQPNDRMREIAATNTTRADFDLPEDAFVFCCFNAPQKIHPREFDIWMRILSAKPDSVLWLFGKNERIEENIGKEAAARGVDPKRLIFGGKLPHSEHLARHKHADLFIDTFNYNAHTTASDALWAGLPIVTMAGEQFAARVAASLLSAIGLPELITETEEAYEALIVELANNPDKLAAIKAKLAENRLTQPLFDSEKYTRDFERGLELVHQRRLQGLAPEDIRVDSTN